jgi:hypothetical protein
MADNVSIARHIGNYFEDSLEVDSPLWHRLVSAAISLPAFFHRQGTSIYMGQAPMSLREKLVHLRHKLKPSDGTIDGLKIIATPYGRLGILECWEHFHAAMAFNMPAQAFKLASTPIESRV